MSDRDEEDTQGLLPMVEVGETAERIEINANERFSRPPARYVEASLVKKLEELGIGRPRHMLPLFQLSKKGYVEKK